MTATASTVVLGMQWGDEGKGKIVDLICPAFEIVARFQGGHNAGHTVKFGDQHFALHLLPSGILHSTMQCVLGNGMVIYPPALFEEIDSLVDVGVDPRDRLFVCDRAQVILPTHVLLDQAREAARGADRIGTTVRGIGPAYESKAARSGIRCGDFLSNGLRQRLEAHLTMAGAQLSALGVDKVPSLDELEALCRDWGKRLAPYLADTTVRLNRALQKGHGVLFEGAQGALLDIDHGTYPFVTSSNSTAGGAATGTGVPPTHITGILGVIKAYTTRVGAGPFVCELEDDDGEHLRRRGNEFGTTTGRPRRCGWFDAVLARYSALINGVDTLALTKLDVLDELDEIKLCTAYRYRGEELRDFPSDLELLGQCEPVYRTFAGWKTSTVGSLTTDDLPENAKIYLRALEEEVGAPIGLISTGPRREETILIASPVLDRLVGGRLEDILAQRGS